LVAKTEDQQIRTHIPDGLGIWAAAVLLALLLGLLAWFGRAWAAPVAVVAVVGVGAYYVRVLGAQVGLLLLMIVTSTIDHYTFRIGPFDLRAEQVGGLMALTWLLVTRLRLRNISWLKPSAAEGLLLLWLAFSVVSSLVASPDRRLSAKIIVLVAFCSLGLFLPRRLLAGPRAAEQMEAVTRWLLIVFATEAGYGFLAYLLHVFGPTLSITPNPASGHLSAYGTLWEQNVFGAFTAAGAVAWVYLGKPRFRLAWLGVAACAGGLVDSLTRAAWLAAAIVGAVGVAVPNLRRRLDFATLGLGAIGGLFVVAATLIVDSRGRYSVSLPHGKGGSAGIANALLNLVDIAGRANQVGPVLADIRGHLLLGRGTASFQALHLVNGVPQHVASLPLLVLNDTGILGAALFVAFGTAVVLRVWSVRRNPIVVGLGQMAVVVALTNLATETTELMVGWLLIGILVAACDATPASATPRRSDGRWGPFDVARSNL
jgi:hypothetical protein